MASFSSRGPNPAALDIIKPDVTAPGINILAAASPIESAVPIPSQRDRHIPPAADPRYEAGVASLVRDIHDGEMLQTVLARRFSMPCSVGRDMTC